MTSDEDQLRAMFGDLAQRQPVRGTDGAFLAPLRRRRQRRLGAVGLSLVLVAAVGVAAAVQRPGGDGQATVATDPTPIPTLSPSQLPTLEPTPSRSPRPVAPVPPLLSAQTGTTLVVVQETRLELLDVDTGQRTLLTTDPRLLGNDRIDVLAVDGQLVLLADNQTGAGNGPYDAFATTAGPGSPLRVIGQASSLHASTHAHRLWLDSTTEDAHGASSSLVEVDLHGVVHQRGAFSTWGVTPFANGFLRGTDMPDGSPGNDTELVDSKNRRLHLYPGTPDLVDGDTAVLANGKCTKDCRVTVLTAGATISKRTVRVDSWPSLSEGSLVRDRSRLFAEATMGKNWEPGGLTELDLTNGHQSHIVDAWAAHYYGPSIRFSPDGRWMFFIDADEKSIDAHDLTTHRSYRVPGTFKTITQLETFA